MNTIFISIMKHVVVANFLTRNMFMLKYRNTFQNSKMLSRGIKHMINELIYRLVF